MSLTGALDSVTSYEVMDLVQKINDLGNTILVVTHEEDIAHMCKRIIHLKDGVIEKDEKVKASKSLRHMFSRDTWKEIFETIQKNKLRTFLSGFTVALGIFIFVVLFGMGNGLINTFDKFFRDDATNVMFIFPGRTTIPLQRL